MKKHEWIESPVAFMVRSGARGNMAQIVQLGGLRGVLTNIAWKELEQPVKGNFREGVSPLEYYLGSHSARRSMCEKKLLTAPAGDFTRMMVEAAYPLTIKAKDCGTTKGIRIFPFPEIDDPAFQGLPPLAMRIVGRFEVDGKGVIDEKRARLLQKRNAPVFVRSPLTCEASKKWGMGAICQKCYGLDLSTSKPPEIGLPVGIIAGESIGERGTQLTMRTFHTGGVGGGAITEGLPRIKALFQNKPVSLVMYRVKKPGDTKLSRKKKYDLWTILIEATRVLPKGRLPLISRAQGDDPVELALHRILSNYGIEVMNLVLSYEARTLYGKDVDEKHFEVILRSMIQETENGSLTLEGINKVSFLREGFLAASSFQRAPSVLAEAAAASEVDPVLGYKENLILGLPLEGLK